MNIRNAQRNYRAGWLLCVATLFSVAVSHAQGTTQQGVVAGAKQYRFEVATIKPNVARDGRSKVWFTPDGFTAMGVPLRKVIEEAFGNYDPQRLLGLPQWGESELIDIEAKFDAATVSNYQDLSLEQRQQMLQALLAERFKLTIHHETRDVDAFAMEVAKGGAKMKQTPPEKIPNSGIKGYNGLITLSQPGQLDITGIPMDGFAGMLRYWVDRIVVNKTGLPGFYDISLRWTPNELSATTMSAPDTSGPSIFSAFQEQLGLKLQLGKFPMDVLVIDHVERPSEN
jgi:uncharacterized protein (TIGR03435 family)